MGTIEHMHMASEASKPIVSLLEAEVIAGRRVEGDRLQNLLGCLVLQPLIDRAGARCDVVTGGTIPVGDAVTPGISF